MLFLKNLKSYIFIEVLLLVQMYIKKIKNMIIMVMVKIIKVKIEIFRQFLNCNK